ncbi:KGG domain-containing protein [Deinococcus daejeonensis]|uniref:Stress-induced protein n=1 Tax=Deinococcus daejeonensis TaxID=1007098 RepID=A0ABQ2JHF0_9DEIO|nr:KGG domain-containing protein [Deinococcus daejeonensis]GGN45328.1 stress-induced protein [Deinococcus daejeonensis]
MTHNKDSNVNGRPRGFARMDPERQRAIASAGGRAAHASGNAHQFTSAEARAAGRKGGQASRKTRVT